MYQGDACKPGRLRARGGGCVGGVGCAPRPLGGAAAAGSTQAERGEGHLWEYGGHLKHGHEGKPRERAF